MGIMREGVKTRLAERGSRFRGDSLKPAWTMPSLASSSLSLEPPLLDVAPYLLTSAAASGVNSVDVSDLRTGDGGRYC